MLHRIGATLALTVSISVPPVDANAFQFELDYSRGGQVLSGCPLNDGVVAYQFTQTSDPGALAAVREGFNLWATVRDVDAFPLLTVYEVPAGSLNTPVRTVTVDVTNFGRDAVLGEATCDLIAINTYATTAKILRAIAVHEMGHVVGLYHTGRDDSFVGDATDPYPAMTTCLSRFENENIYLRNDDRAAAAFFHGERQFDRFGTEFRSVTANAGFENALDAWAWPGSTSVSLTTASVKGSRSAWIRSTTGPAVLFQRVNISPQREEYGYRVFATAHTKRHTSTDYGSVGLYLYERVVAYAPPDDKGIAAYGECDSTSPPYTIRRQANYRTYVGSRQQLGSATCIARVEWENCESEFGDTVGSAIDYYDASDLTIELRSNVKTSTGAWAGVDIDSASVGHYNTVIYDGIGVSE